MCADKNTRETTHETQTCGGKNNTCKNAVKYRMSMVRTGKDGIVNSGDITRLCVPWL